MIRRTTPHTITQNQVLSEESFTGKKGIDITQAPVVRDTVEDIVNMDIDLDGAMTIRKPMKSLNILNNVSNTVLFTKNIYDNEYFYITKDESDNQYLISSSGLPIYLKSPQYTYLVNAEFPISNYYVDLTDADIVNMNTSSLLTNVKIDLVHFMGSIYYNNNLKFTETIASLKIYKGTFGVIPCYYLEYLDPYVATIESTETLAFNPNTAGNYTYALTDTYNSYSVKVNGILAYTNGTATAVQGLTETNNNGHYIISSLNENYNNPIILKAFCNFVKNTDIAKYYCAWEYSFDNVIWETLPEFKNQWKNTSSYTILSVQNLASINYELSTDIKTVYNTINKEVVSLNIIDDATQLISSRPDIISVNKLDKAVYRFVIYRNYEYYQSYSSKEIIKLANVNSTDIINKNKYNFLRIVNSNNADAQDFNIEYTVPIGFSESNLSCKITYLVDGGSLTTTTIPLDISTISTNNNIKVIRIQNSESLSISPPTVTDYVGKTGKLNATIKFYYINNVKFDEINYQIVYLANSDINTQHTYIKDFAIVYVGDTYTTDIEEAFFNNRYSMSVNLKFDPTNSQTYLITNTYNPTDHQEDYNVNETVYSIDTLDKAVNVLSSSYKELITIPYFTEKSFKTSVYNSMKRKPKTVANISSITFNLYNSKTNALITKIYITDPTRINELENECDPNSEIVQGGYNLWLGHKSSLPSYGNDGIIVNALINTSNTITNYSEQLLCLDHDYAQYYLYPSATLTDLINTIKTETYYNLDIDKAFVYADDSTQEIANTIGMFDYTMPRTSNTEILNTDFINSNKGKKLYYKYRLYSYNDVSFKNNIFVSNSDSLITPLFNAIDLPITSDSIITGLTPWREYLIASSDKGIFLITPVDDGFTTKILSTFIGIPSKDGDTLKAILNGAIFKSGSKVYILQPSLYASNDSTINIVDISKPISKYIVDTDYDNFAFTTEQYYYLCIPNNTDTTVLKYEFATKRWTKHIYPDRFIKEHIVSLDDIRVIGEKDVYQIEKDITEYSEYQSLTGYGDILNGVITPIHYEINTGPKSYSMQYPHQFVETKILFGVLDDSNAQLPLQVDIYSDNFKNILHIDPSTSNTLWRDTVAPREITNVNDNSTILTLNSDTIADDKVIPILKQLFLRYSGKGFTVTHHLKGESNCYFKCYVIYVRFKETINKK